MPDLSFPCGVVSGGRDYDNGGRIAADLRVLRDRAGLRRLSQGGARGADERARLAALGLGLDGQTYPALWEIDGKRLAGGRRNQRMIDAERPDLGVCYADPRSSGTWDFAERALAAGIPILAWLPPDHWIEHGQRSRVMRRNTLPPRAGRKPRPEVEAVLQIAPHAVGLDAEDEHGRRLVVAPVYRADGQIVRSVQAAQGLAAALWSLVGVRALRREDVEPARAP